MAESGPQSDKGNGTWVEAVIERSTEPKIPEGSLRLCEYREFDAEARTSTLADWNCPSVDP